MKALILVGLQNDFLPGGARAVSQGDVIVPLANRLRARFGIAVVTQVWHPASHTSFAANHRGRSPGDVVTIKGVKRTLGWPYCVQHTEGAKLAPNLQMTGINKVFTLGTEPEIESHSAFFDGGRLRVTGLEGFFKLKKVTEVYVLGLATEDAVKSTALDARELGFKTFLIEDACRGRDAAEVKSALEEMKKAGVKMVRSRTILED